ncbi:MULTISPECIES: hypothetical protein [Streptomyces]|uniref:hypothetical protein n=1 Tax=Streptomyces TaxID=1883 RepID=UPI001109D584|nr:MULTISPECIES: hypothetical protein [Streptomyces]
MSRQGVNGTTDLARSPMRPVALSLCVLSAVMVVLSLISDGNAFSDSWWLVAFVLWLLLWGVLRSMTRGVAERPQVGLDERERGLRDQVSFIGYQCAVGAGMVVVLLMVVFQNQPDMIERMPALLTTLMLTASAVPSVILGMSGVGVEDADEDEDE